MITRLDIIRESDRLTVLNQIPETEVSVFHDEVYFTLASVAALLELQELDILKVIKNFEWVTVDLEFDERSHRLTVHDGESYTGRPLVTGITWTGLKSLVMAFNTQKCLQLARDIVTVDFEITNPPRVAAYYNRVKGTGQVATAPHFGLRKR
jgi:hypothetical protein